MTKLMDDWNAMKNLASEIVPTPVDCHQKKIHFVDKLDALQIKASHDQLITLQVSEEAVMMHPPILSKKMPIQIVTAAV